MGCVTSACTPKRFPPARTVSPPHERQSKPKQTVRTEWGDGLEGLGGSWVPTDKPPGAKLR